MKRQWFVLCLVIALLFVVGCASTPYLSEPDYAKSNSAAPQAAPAAPAPMEAPMADMVEMETAISAEEAGWGVNESSDSAAQRNDYGGHKIIRNASLGMETREFDLHVAHIKQKVDDMGGYISSSYTSGRTPEKYGDYGRYASIAARIPSERMDAFLADARGLATVTYENSSGEDITSSYYDTESRLNIYETQRDRIMKLLETAETMEDIIKLETELSRLTYEIEGLTTQLKRWDNLVDFATVTIDLTEIAPSYAVSSDDSVGTRISEGFAKTLNGMVVFFENLFVFVVALMPLLILLAVVAIVVLFIIRRKHRKNVLKKDEKSSNESN